MQNHALNVFTTVKPFQKMSWFRCKCCGKHTKAVLTKKEDFSKKCGSTEKNNSLCRVWYAYQLPCTCQKSGRQYMPSVPTCKKNLWIIWCLLKSLTNLWILVVMPDMDAGNYQLIRSQEVIMWDFLVSEKQLNTKLKAKKFTSVHVPADG